MQGERGEDAGGWGSAPAPAPASSSSVLPVRQLSGGPSSASTIAGGIMSSSTGTGTGSGSGSGSATPRLKIRLGGTGGGGGGQSGVGVTLKGKEREHHPATPAATPGAGASSSSSIITITPNGHHRQQQQQQQQNGHIDQNDQASNGQQQQQQQPATRTMEPRDLEELPQIARQHLVPLTELVRRAISKSFNDLQSLVEVSVSFLLLSLAHSVSGQPGGQRAGLTTMLGRHSIAYTLVGCVG